MQYEFLAFWKAIKKQKIAVSLFVVPYTSLIYYYNDTT